MRLRPLPVGCLPLLGALLALGVPAVPALAQDAVGKVSAVNPKSTGSPPGGASRTLELNTQVIYRERIATSAAGSLQLVFTDTSTISLGPNTDLVIDEYVFDPASGNGRTTLSLTKGALRFVGGQNSHGGNTEVRTPNATMGLRGAAGTITYDPQTGLTRLFSSFGVFTVSNPAGTEVVRRPGFVVTVGNGQPPTAPRRAEQSDFDTLTRGTTSKPGEFGGATEKPSDTTARSRLSTASLKVDPGSVRSQSENASGAKGGGSDGQFGSRDYLKQVQTANILKAVETLVQTGSPDDAPFVRPAAGMMSPPVNPAADAQLTPSPAVDLSQTRAALEALVATSASAVTKAGAARDSALAQASAAESRAGTADRSNASATARAAALAQASRARAAADQAVAAYNSALAALAALRSQLAALGSATTAESIAAIRDAAVQQAQRVADAIQVVAQQGDLVQASSTNTSSAVTASNVAAPRVFALRMSAGAGSSVPYLTGGFVGPANAAAATVSPVIGRRLDGAVSGDGLSATAGRIRSLQVAFALSGQGVAQSSLLMAANGFSYGPVGGSTNKFDFIGGFFASARANATSGPSFASGNVGTDNGGLRLDDGQLPTDYNVSATALAGGLLSGKQASTFGYTTPGGYDYNQTATRIDTPAGTGEKQVGAPLNGYVSGILSSVLLGPKDSAGNRPFVSGSGQSFLVSGTTGTPGDVGLAFDASRAAVAGKLQLSSNNPGSRYVSGTYYLGSFNAANPNTRSTYVDDASYVLRGSADQFSSAKARTDAAPVFYEDNAQQAVVPWSAIAASNPGAGAQYFPGVTICQCTYTQWGFWSLGVVRNSTSGNPYDADYGNLIPWVAGQTAALGQMPHSGTATYSGHVIANVANGANQYIAAGNFANTVNFATGAGAVTVNGLDSRNYAGTVALSGTSFAGSLAQTTAPAAAVGSIKGSFYGPGTPPAEMGGQLQISNGSYLAGGVFAAKR